MKDALSARIVAHYLGEEDDLPAPARAALEDLGIGILAAPRTAQLGKLAEVAPADVLLISVARIPDSARELAALKGLFGERGVPVILLAGTHAPADAAARLLAEGADDVMPAPVDPALLAARIESALRTVEQLSVSAGWPRRLLRTADGEIALDVTARRCLVRREEGYRDVRLTAKQFSTLAALVRAGGKAVRWRDLLRAGWPGGKSRRTGAILVHHILELRRKLGPAGRRIAAVTGVGYQLTLTA
ncbi:MAG: response regulator transcription factor [Elusimicrobiota bacterium]